MNMTDAERFCKKLNVAAIPLHCGLFDDIDMKQWKYENKTIPKIYKEIELYAFATETLCTIKKRLPFSVQSAVRRFSIMNRKKHGKIM